MAPKRSRKTITGRTIQNHEVLAYERPLSYDSPIFSQGEKLEDKVKIGWQDIDERIVLDKRNGLFTQERRVDQYVEYTKQTMPNLQLVAPDMMEDTDDYTFYKDDDDTNKAFFLAKSKKDGKIYQYRRNITVRTLQGGELPSYVRGKFVVAINYDFVKRGMTEIITRDTATQTDAIQRAIREVLAHYDENGVIRRSVIDNDVHKLTNQLGDTSIKELAPRR